MNKKNIIESAFVQDMSKTTANLYRLGWDERNGGNISYRLTEAELAPYLDTKNIIRTIPVSFQCRELAGQYFLVTGTGKYFKNVQDSPEENLGIIRVTADGEHVELLWGYADGGLPTSELPTHFMSHIERLKVDAEHRVIIHTHATNIIAMTFTHSLDEREFTRTLWQMCTESLVVFPDGVGIIPWMVPGTEQIGRATAEKMKECRVVVWPHHGVLGAGRTLDETFGLIETVEKSAQVYTLVKAQGAIKQTITDRQLADLAKAFHVEPRKGFLSV